MEYVTIVNRTTKPLNGTWDGRHYTINPGKHEFPRNQADAFRRQNPVMGTGLFGDQDTQYLIGIIEDNDDCSPIEQSKAVSVIPESQYSLPVEVVHGKNGIHSVRDVSTSLPLDSNFVKP